MNSKHPRFATRFLRAVVGATGLAFVVAQTVGCATVRPEQRAILAEPVMQFDEDPREAAATQHVLENREGSYGGGSVRGGGCGCN